MDKYKLYYGYTESEGVKEHSFSTDRDNLPEKTLYMCSISADNLLDLAEFVDHGARQIQEVVTLEINGYVREYRHGKLEDSYHTQVYPTPLDKRYVLSEAQRED